jgi:ferredoxin
MAEEVDIKFEREELEGVVPVGTYLSDAAKRFGVRFEKCDATAGEHYCQVMINSGAKLLSPATQAETAYFAERTRRKNERLACQARVEKPGEIVVMTDKKAKEVPAPEAPAEDVNEQYRKQFADLPLEKKIANLVQLESMALGDTVSFIINSPFKIADKVMDVMAEFGFKKEEAEREAARPEEHKAKEATAASNGSQSTSPDDEATATTGKDA